MKQFFSFLVLTMLLVACSDSSSNIVEGPSDNTVETHEENNESKENEGKVSDNMLELSSTLITSALEEMTEWNSFISNSIYDVAFTDHSENSTTTSYMEYIASPRAVFVEVNQPHMFIKKVNYYGTEENHTAYYNYDSDGYMETDKDNGILKDHLSFRHDLLSLIFEKGESLEVESDDTYLNLTMTIPVEFYEDFAIILRDVTNIEAYYDMDLKSQFKNVTATIMLSGIDLYGYIINIEYPDDDIDGVQSYTVTETFESINELEYIDTPFAG